MQDPTVDYDDPQLGQKSLKDRDPMGELLMSHTTSKSFEQVYGLGPTDDKPFERQVIACGSFGDSKQSNGELGD